MDSDAVDASSLASVSQPLDVLRLDLQNEPTFEESSIPKDDHTLTFVQSPLLYEPLHLNFFWELPRHRPAPVNVAHRRFLKARGYSASQAKQMILDCIEWRRTVEDVGIEELYRSIDPFDVRSVLSLSCTLFLCVL
jgi:hypothetical protein